MPEPAIAVEGLTKVFAGSGIGRRSGETVAVSDVSFEVDAGAAFAIMRQKSGTDEKKGQHPHE